MFQSIFKRIVLSYDLRCLGSTGEEVRYIPALTELVWFSFLLEFLCIYLFLIEIYFTYND